GDRVIVVDGVRFCRLRSRRIESVDFPVYRTRKAAHRAALNVESGDFPSTVDRERKGGGRTRNIEARDGLNRPEKTVRDSARIGEVAGDRAIVVDGVWFRINRARRIENHYGPIRELDESVHVVALVRIMSGHQSAVVDALDFGVNGSFGIDANDFSVRFS